MNQDKLVLAAILALALGVGGFVLLNHGGFGQDVQQTAPDVSSGQSTQKADTSQGADAAEADPEPTSTPAPEYYEGKVADLPDVARAVLSFEPVDSENQTQSESIANRVYEICSLGDYVGADDFPGRIRLNNKPHGWTEVTWTISKCAGLSQGPIKLGFELSHDQSHIRYVTDDAYALTH